MAEEKQGVSQLNSDSEWNPVYDVFHRFFCVETKRFVSSTVNVILMQQTCRQRSSVSEGGKGQALQFRFSIRITYIF